ncbi:putative UDP-rhamnose:rhamnosyltransferase 1 [Cinnamomum micranthum f. kanehirae]|uniref:Glycosyltransferase n=1 Tax=Cinnamomum micranthum f. kanehirae TaxID=337451 RepID=A0A3S3QNN5_9MAGN|nr:putative UDP-rhamnose:rhamnosyltransferase 1 [Cinnamomum micranthum f. kanehirae]
MEDGVLHIAVMPWLAFGHLGPFLEFSKALANRGHHILFISTPKNIQRLPKIPPHLSPHIDLVGLPLPHTNGLPDGAESTMDTTLDQMHCLKNAFDGLEGPVAALLESAAPDWIIYDLINHWVPRIATKLRLPCAHLSIFPALLIGFLGPPSGLMDGGRFMGLESLINVPPWVQFPTTVSFCSHEVIPILKLVQSVSSGVTDFQRYGSAIGECGIIAIRDCMELSSDWFRLLEDLHQKPVFPIGLLPPPIQEADGGDEAWPGREWLDKQAHGSTVYIALGSEVRPSKEQVHQLAFGLEQSQLPFIWALRSGAHDPEILPLGFEDRIKGRGIVRKEWVPQLKILAHPSIGGFLTHGGWSSIIEGLGLGRPLVILPLMYDQGLNARWMEEKRLGLEVPMYQMDGSFTGTDVAKTSRKVMVEVDGNIYRANAVKMKEVFANNKLSDQYIDFFVRDMKDNRGHNRFLSSCT